jgi:hypothetical protein
MIPVLHDSNPRTLQSSNTPKRSPFLFLAFALVLSVFQITGTLEARASPGSKALSLTHFGENPVEMTWGGHIRLRGTFSSPEEGSFYEAVDSGTYEDGTAEARLKSTLFLGKKAYFEAHYETFYSVGDTQRAQSQLADLLPQPLKGLFAIGALEDDSRFMDLTKTIHSDDDSIWYQRLDRLYLTWLPEWGSFSIGRQAVTWGNGYVFNPMDLVNPFPPTDIERDYKIGSDMVIALVNLGSSGDLQLVYVPRRNPLTDEVSWDQSTLGGKVHLSRGTTEFDVMAVADYGDAVLGLGSRGYLGGAAWRCDATWTFVDDSPRKTGFLSLVANLDYSWVWWGKNFYGFLEFYYNGLGDDDYLEALRDPALLARLARGELYTLGKYYLSGHVSMEVHPLFNLYLTVINNLEDPSGVVQPRAIWNVSQNVDLTIGANLYYGGKGTEYGGIVVPGTPYLYSPSLSFYLWLGYYF